MSDGLISVVSSQPQYLAHIQPIWDALPDHLKGEVLTGPAPRGKLSEWVIVAGGPDSRRARSSKVIWVEHGAGQSYCLAPQTRVLTCDLEWVPISELVLGQKLVAFEETKSDRAWRQWEIATVTETRRLMLPCYRLHMADGTVITASEDHRWLTRDRQRFEWTKTKNLQDAARWPRRSSKMLKAFDTWEEDRSWGAGYLAAAFDGEGYLTQTGRYPRQNRIMLGFSQRENAMLAVVSKELDERGFIHSQALSGGTNGDVMHVGVLGGTKEIYRFLGTIRPRRLLANMTQLQNGQMRGSPVELLYMEPLGEQEVIGLATSSGTFIAEGFASHNSGEKRTARHSHYVGGIGHDHVRLFLAPGEAPAARWRRFYPDARVEAIGCARLDKRLGQTIHRGTVAMTWHWNASLIPETRWALPEYNRALPGIIAGLRDLGFEVIGHCHPRSREQMMKRYKVLGVEYVDSLDEVFDRAGTLIVDNSSSGFEAAALGLSTVWLNASYYRRNVNHGLRFWNRLPGPSVDAVEPWIGSPDRVADRVTMAFDHLKQWRAYWETERQHAVNQIYAYTDGSSTQRAVDAILETVLA